LIFTAWSDLDAPLPISIRIHDARHDQRFEDRYNTVVVLGPGAARVVIPLEDVRMAPQDRVMDMHAIRAIVLFAHKLKRPARIYLGEFFLE
jgi:hypothetical protein